ncbi:transmembrane protein 176B [Pseudophryne corroboree]|uniref:transmembrane protein 176B n=1 Tax=Pseudophryne corroboree TaxID=495146 RepID=UPI003081B1E6
MPVSILNAENRNISCETPEGAAVHIHINQRSALDCLLDTMRMLKSKRESDTKPANHTSSAERLGVGISLISLGCISVMLAIILCVVKPWLIIFFKGTHFWVGFPFIICGALNVVSYRCPKRCWEALAFISLLVSLSVSIAGMIFATNDLIQASWKDDYPYLCESLLRGRNRYNYGYVTPRPTIDYDNWELKRCKMGFKQYQSLLHGLVNMTLIMMVWGICISLIGLGCRLKALCCGCTNEKPVEERDNSLVPKTTTGETFIA